MCVGGGGGGGGEGRGCVCVCVCVHVQYVCKEEEDDIPPAILYM